MKKTARDKNPAEVPEPEEMPDFPAPLPKAANRGAQPPKGLSIEAKGLWKSILEEYEVSDAAGYLLLGTALEAFDEMRAAQKILAVDGPVIVDRFGGKKQHPITLVIRDSRNLMLRSLKAMNLDIAPDSPLGGGK